MSIKIFNIPILYLLSLKQYTKYLLLKYAMLSLKSSFEILDFASVLICSTKNGSFLQYAMLVSK